MDNASELRYRRTKVGKAEFRKHTTPLSRSARNLLLMIDESHTGAQWVQLVQGSGEVDLALLISMGFIAVSGSETAAEPSKPVTLDEALQRWSYDELSKFLTAQTRERFGLLRGYHLILQIEGCSNVDEMRAVALKFVDSVRRSHGREPAVRLCRQFGAS